jgi:hypothetical protein
MGLFGFVGKLAGKVARFGLSRLTHGASDKVLAVLKSRGAAKPGLKSPRLDTTQKQALMEKLGDLAPRVQNSTIYTDALAGGATMGTYRKRMPGRRKRARQVLEGAPVGRPSVAAGVPRRRHRRSTGRGRELSPGMRQRATLMQALAAEWRAAGGREGTGQTFFEWKRGR